MIPNEWSGVTGIAACPRMISDWSIMTSSTWSTSTPLAFLFRPVHNSAFSRIQNSARFSPPSPPRSLRTPRLFYPCRCLHFSARPYLFVTAPFPSKSFYAVRATSYLAALLLDRYGPCRPTVRLFSNECIISTILLRRAVMHERFTCGLFNTRHPRRASHC